MPASGQVVSKKRKFVADGVFRAELDEFLRRELGEDGYAGVEVRDTPMRTEIVIRATRTQNVLGEKGRRIRELTTAVQKRFKFAEGSIELFAERVPNRGCVRCGWDGARVLSSRNPLSAIAFMVLAFVCFVPSFAGCARRRSASLSGSNWRVAWPFAGLRMVWSDLSWRAAPRAARLSSAERCLGLGPRR